jgi:ABC-2 type transport system ATP-binding protein
MINVQSLSRHFGKFTAVDDVTFRIGNNEVVGLLGHNGAGKSTIMKMLSGYLEPSAGQIRIAGIDMATNARTVQQKLGFLPENLPLYPDMMVADYLDYVATLKGIAAKERPGAVGAAIAATDLGDRALDTIFTLSRGLKQRLGVAQAVLGKPRLLILDEPTNGLDPGQTHKMRELIKALSQSATVILSTHIMQEVDALCDRVLMLRSGRLILDERHDELCSSRCLMLRTSAGIEPLETYLRRLPQVATLTCSAKSPDYMEYNLSLHDNADLNTASNNVAQCVVKAGAKLFMLQPLVQNLETIFTEANTGGDHPDGH